MTKSHWIALAIVAALAVVTVPSNLIAASCGDCGSQPMEAIPEFVGWGEENPDLSYCENGPGNMCGGYAQWTKGWSCVSAPEQMICLFNEDRLAKRYFAKTECREGYCVPVGDEEVVEWWEAGTACSRVGFCF